MVEEGRPTRVRFFAHGHFARAAVSTEMEWGGVGVGMNVGVGVGQWV